METDRILQLVHGVQVFLPYLVDGHQQEAAFDLVEVGFRNDLAELFVAGLAKRDDFVEHLFGRLAHGVFESEAVFHAEAALQVDVESFEVPGFGVALCRNVGGHLDIAGVLDAVHDFFADVFAVQNAATESVNHLALFVHHVIVVEQVLTDIEALAFHAALGTTDGAAHDRVGNHFVFAHAKTGHQVLDAVATEDTHQVVVEAKEVLAGTRVALTAGTATQLVVDTAGFMAFGAEHVQATELGNSRAKGDVGTTTGHVGCNGHLVLVAGVLDDFSFAAMVLRVQDFVRDAFLFQETMQVFGLFDGCRTNEERLALAVAILDFGHDSAPLGIFGLVHHVLQVLADAGAVGRNHPGVHVVNLDEFRGFGFGGTRHTRKLLVHAEVILERNRCKRLVFATDLHAFLGFDRLVHTVAVTAAFHKAARIFVDDDDFGIADDVVHVLFVEVPGLEGVIEKVNPVGVFAVQVRNVHEFLNVVHALFGQLDVLVLFVDREVLVLDELLRDFVGLGVLFGSVFGRTTNNKRRTGFVDQDGVHFVDDTEVQFALHQLAGFHGHVVAQVVEAEFVVGTVGHVAVVAHAAFFGVEAVHDEAHRKSEELIDHAHLLGVTAGEVIVHRHHVHTVARKTVQVNRQGGGKGLTFTGRHFGDGTFVEHEAADHLHVERHHAERLHRFGVKFADLRVHGGGQVDFPFVLAGGKFGLRGVHRFLELGAQAAKVEVVFGLENVEDTQAAVASFLAYGKGFDLDVFEGSAIPQLFAEFRTLGGQGGVIQGFQGFAGLMDLLDDRAQLLDLTFVRGTKDLVKNGIDYAHLFPFYGRRHCPRSLIKNYGDNLANCVPTGKCFVPKQGVNG